MSKLEVLDLSDNCLEGGLPTSLRSLLLLRTFSAADNELSGELPSFLGDFTMLTKLTLNGNKFNGPIPRELGKLVSLERLYLERNELVRFTVKSFRADLDSLYFTKIRLPGRRYSVEIGLLKSWSFYHKNRAMAKLPNNAELLLQVPCHSANGQDTAKLFGKYRRFRVNPKK